MATYRSRVNVITVVAASIIILTVYTSADLGQLFFPVVYVTDSPRKDSTIAPNVVLPTSFNTSEKKIRCVTAKLYNMAFPIATELIWSSAKCYGKESI